MGLQKRTYTDQVTVITADNLNDIQDAIIALENSGNRGVTEDIRQALLQIAQKVAYIDDQGQSYYDDLYNALYSPANIVSISAVYTQSGTVYETDSLDSLKTDLVVTALYDDASTETVPSADYSLSGTLTAGTSTITVTYGGKTATFDVTVVGLSSITAVFTPGNYTFFTDTPLSKFKEFLVVTANYEGGATETVSADDYTLSGTLAAGTNTITVAYSGKTTTFTVTATSAVIPSGYTQYSYITSKTPGTNAKAVRAGFIVLPAQPDMNVLSMEALISKNGDADDGAGYMGARVDTSLNSFAVYCQSEYGIIFNVRGISIGTDTSLQANVPTRVELINPAASPIYWRINGGELHEKAWTTSPVANCGMMLFNNAPYTDTTTQYNINNRAQIGNIILRKNDGECVGYYVPAVYSSKIGMYDFVTSTFYTASTASYVTIGNSNCKYAVGNWS